MPPAKQPRSSARKMRNHSAWISVDGDKLSYQCRVLDISARGAKLVTDVDVPVGSLFRLSTMPYATVHRLCKVLWRRGRQIGVAFPEETAVPAL